MTALACTFERFRKDTANHSMEVKQDNSLFRHLVFSNNGSSSYRFELITWPGYLCICGDMNTYVFRRVTDMFEFFRRKNCSEINPGYWGEKLEAEHSSHQNTKWGKAWSIDAFKSAVNRYLDSGLKDPECEETATEIRGSVKHELEFIDDEHEAITFIRDFECNDFRFEDFEYDTDEYTFRYLWCCYAITWGIQQYDALHKQSSQHKRTQKLLRVTELAYQISQANIAWVHVRYYPHVDELCVTADPVNTDYQKLTQPQPPLFRKDLYLSAREFQTEDQTQEALNEVIQQLENLISMEPTQC